MEIASSIVILATALILLTVWSYKAYIKYAQNVADTFEELSDRGLLLLILDQPDKMITVDRLVDLYGWKKSVARSRFYTLLNNKVVEYHSSVSMKYYYEFNEDIDTTLLSLSDQPYISVEDLIRIFEHFNHDVSLAKICLATNLPIKEIKREMKYFVKEKILEVVYNNHGKARYLLKEPFRSQSNLLDDIELSEQYKQVKYSTKDSV